MRRNTMATLFLRMLPGILLLATVLPAAAQREPLALLVRSEGSVRVLRGQPRRPVDAAPGVQLFAGDRLKVATGARVVLLHRSGRTETRTQSITLSPPRSQETSGIFTRTLRTLVQLASSDGRVVPMGAAVVRGAVRATEVARPLRPGHGAATAEVRPTFVWSRVPGAAGYVVELFEDGRRFHRAVVEADTTWTLPDGVAALVRGRSYAWSVAALHGGDGTMQRFRVAGEAEMKGLCLALGEIRATGLDPERDGLLLSAVAYHDAGLFYEVLSALDRLAARGEARGPLYHRLRTAAAEATGDSRPATR